MKLGSLKIVINFLAKHKLKFIEALWWRIIWEIIPMQIPLLAGMIIDGLTDKPSRLFGQELPFNTVSQILNFAVVALMAIALLYGISSYCYTMSAARLSIEFVAELKKELALKITALSLARQNQLGAGELLDRTLRDPEHLRSFIEKVFIRSCSNLVRIGYPIIMLVSISPVLAAIALSVIPLQWLISWRLQKRLNQVTRAALRSHSQLTSCVKEGIDGAETLQNFGAELYQVKKIARRVDLVESLEEQTDRLTALLRGTTWLMTTMGIALIWWQGSLQVIDAQISLGTLVVFIGLAEFAYRPFRYFPKIVKFYERGLASLERIKNLLDLPSTIEATKTAPPLQLETGAIEFNHVCFEYAQREILHDINLKIEPRQLTALIGGSGSGKSSLLRLINRLYDPSAGTILIDGQPLAQIELSSLRSQIAVVSQRPILFSGSLFENLTIAAPDATPAQVEAACVAAGAIEFIQELPLGLKTAIGSQGVQLSGGQVQRLALARALLKNPRILLLDEPTSALDGQCRTAIISTLLQLKGKMTIILAEHHVETFRCAEQIVLLDRGQIVAVGNYQQLLVQSADYHRLYPQDEFNNGKSPKIGQA